MKKSLILFVILILFNYGCKQRTINKAKNIVGKGLVAKNKYYDFGQVSQSKLDSIDFSFLLLNSGDSDISIHDIDVSCRCVVVEQSFQTIHPYETKSITGKIGIKGQEKRINKSIFVNYANDNVLLLRVKGVVTE